jgi:hypothetical protein
MISDFLITLHILGINQTGVARPKWNVRSYGLLPQTRTSADGAGDANRGNRHEAPVQVSRHG